MGSPDNGFIAHSLGEEVRRLGRLAIPVAGTQLSIMLLGFVDTVMLGWYDVNAMAAAMSANIWTLTTLFFANGILFGLDPIISQAHGAGDGRRAGLALQRALVMALLLSIPVGASWLLTGPFLLATGQDEALIPMAQTYATIMIPAVPFFLVYSARRTGT